MPPKKARKLGATATHRSKAKQEAKPKLTLLDLPLDVRDIIYGILLLEPGKIQPNMQFNDFVHEPFFVQMMPHDMHPPRFSYCGHPQVAGMQPQILRVNRQMHDEAARVLYGRNTFAFSDDHSCCPNRYDEMSMDWDPDEEETIHMQEVNKFKLFLVDIGAENRALLRKLKLTFNNVETLGRGYVPATVVKLRRFLGSSFVDAFRLLSQGHSLQSLHIDLQGCKMPDALVARKDLLTAICSIKKIPDLQIDSACSCDEDHPGSSLNTVRLQVSQAAGSESYQFPKHASGRIKYNPWGEVAGQVKLSQGSDGSALTAKILKLVKEKAVLDARILEDIERRDFIAKMLDKADSEVSL